MKNIGSIISSHKKQVLLPCNENYGYNCRKKLSVRQQIPCVQHHYKPQISNNTDDEHKKYLDAAENSFKERYSKHTRDFKHKKYNEVY